MSALTDRYIDAVTSRLPEDTREDIAREIQATVSDMVNDRLGGDEEPEHDLGDRTEPSREAIEREALEELGDPVLLSREYSNSPQHLIGPATYPLFIKCIKWILPLVGVVSLLTSSIITIATNPGIQLGSLLGPIIGNLVTALLTAFASITIILALGDRFGTGNPGSSKQGSGASSNTTKPTPRWTVDDLNQTDPEVGRIRSEAIVNLVVLPVLAAIPLIPTTMFYVGHLNNGETFINPGLGTIWLIGYWALLALMMIVEIMRLVRPTRSISLVVASTVVDVAMAIFLTVALLTQPVLHPDLTTSAGANLQQVITVVAIWVLTIWDQINTWRGYRSIR